MSRFAGSYTLVITSDSRYSGQRPIRSHPQRKETLCGIKEWFQMRALSEVVTVALRPDRRPTAVAVVVIVVFVSVLVLALVPNTVSALDALGRFLGVPAVGWVIYFLSAGNGRQND